jgi:formamidopyrimidine-DNA glycosylase
MPELPDLVYLEAVLARALVGHAIVQGKVGDPVVLRCMVRDPFPALLVGKHIQDIKRVGQFMRFAIDDGFVLVVNAMLTGRYALVADDAPARRDLILGIRLADGRELRYSDETRMGKIYVAQEPQLRDIPGYRDLGVDLLSPDFTLECFLRLASKRRDQVRQFLLDKTALASVGNAYADEILFAARLHPKTLCSQLGAEDMARLYQAIGTTLAWAIGEITRRAQPIEVKLRDFLKVRGRSGQACYVCGTTLRQVRVGRDDACFCPTCQPATRRLFVDFSKLPRKI